MRHGEDSWRLQSSGTLANSAMELRDELRDVVDRVDLRFPSARRAGSVARCGVGAHERRLERRGRTGDGGRAVHSVVVGATEDAAPTERLPDRVTMLQRLRRMRPN